jgi:hypothetical protein
VGDSGRAAPQTVQVVMRVSSARGVVGDNVLEGSLEIGVCVANAGRTRDVRGEVTHGGGVGVPVVEAGNGRWGILEIKIEESVVISRIREAR